MKIKLCVAMLLSCITLSGCGAQTQTLYSSDTVEVTQTGRNTAVCDLVSGKEYNYTTKRVRRSDAITEPYTSIDTETIKVDVLPDAGLQVQDKAAHTVFTMHRIIRRKKG